MNHDLDRDLLRMVTGKLDPERRERIERAIAEDATVRRRLEEYRELWRDLELPAPAPADLLTAVRRRVVAGRADAEVGLAELWRFSPAWGRALAAASLAAGVALGVWLGESTLVGEEPSLLERYEPSLAESYWTEVETEAQGPGGEEER